MASAPFLSFMDVTIRQGEALCFGGLEWTLHTDEHWGIVGPTGSGKSVLAGALGGRVPIVRGEVVYWFAGQRPDDPYGWGEGNPEEDIAYVSFEAQRALLLSGSPYYQFRWYAGAEAESPTVRQALLRAARDTGRKLLGEVTGLLGIEELLKRHIVHLSHGETRKFLLAEALMRTPKLLVLDEPLSGLDAASRARFAEVLGTLMQGAMRVVVVTSRRDELPEAITHVVEVEDGQVVRMGRRGKNFSGAGRKAPAGKTPQPAAAPKAENKGGRVLIEIRNAEVVYDGNRILQDVSWVVRAGEHWALLGPNGAGKTTLLSLILGDNPQCYANHVEVCGMRRGHGESLWEVRRCLGYLSPDLHAHFPLEQRVLDAVGSGLRDTLGLLDRLTRKQRAQALAWIERVGLLDKAEMPLAGLSAGEQRLALLARALVKRPPLLILDEPTHGLDDAHRALVREVVDAVGQAGETTILYVTHYPEDLPACVQHVLALERGRVVRRS